MNMILLRINVMWSLAHLEANPLLACGMLAECLIMLEMNIDACTLARAM